MATAGTNGNEVTSDMAEALKRLAREYRDEAGQPLPNDLQTWLYTLAGEAYQLADAQGKSSPSTLAIARSSNNYVETYESLTSTRQKYTQYDEVYQLVNMYSGIISSVTDEAFLEDSASTSHANLHAFAAMKELYPMDTTGMTAVQAQHHTETSAQGIEELGHNLPHYKK